jgi:hypothetical protein
MGLKEKLKKIFIFENKKPEPTEFKTLSKEEYEKMSVSELLNLRHNKRIPPDELQKVLNVLEVKFPPGVCHCRNWG